MKRDANGNWQQEHAGESVACAMANTVDLSIQRQQQQIANNPYNNSWSYQADRVRVLEAAIRKHRDYRGNNRCHRDDTELYKVLPEGYEPPAMDTAIELEECKKFIACRQNPETVYVSPEQEIERLRAEVKRLEGLTSSGF